MATKKKAEKQPKPLVSKSPSFRIIYVTGAVGNLTPFDYRIAFYTHESVFPDTPKEIEGVAVAQVFQVELAMSYNLMKNLRDLLDRQIKQLEEKAQKPKSDSNVTAP